MSCNASRHSERTGLKARQEVLLYGRAKCRVCIEICREVRLWRAWFVRGQQLFKAYRGRQQVYS